MRSAIVQVNRTPAGRLRETERGFEFTYLDHYLNESSLPPVSLTLPRRREPYHADTLFPFFYGLLAEGSLKTEQCRKLRMDEEDHFGRLLKTVRQDAIGAVTVHEEED